MRLIDADRYEFPGDLKDEPTIDAVPVVRCRDCKWSTPSHREGEYRCSIDYEIWQADDYCSSGKRREDGDT